ncbi:hypothetical protein BDZ91DRAFT_775525 [Kalaharituber pfeilii]|nr:hypothetical protein BDZ91DRAFT_775525 [Kalaharituber pfeilii]
MATDRWGSLEGYYTGLHRLVKPDQNVPEYPPPYGGRKKESGQRPVQPQYLEPKSIEYNPYTDFGAGYVECDYHDYDDHHHHHLHNHKNGDEHHEDAEEKEDPSRPVKVRPRPQLRAFYGIPEGYPDPVFGSHEMLGLNGDVCFDRYGKLGPYGFGYEVGEGGLGVGLGTPSTKAGEGGVGPGSLPLQKIDWMGIDWGKVQRRCVDRNKGRFAREDGMGVGMGMERAREGRNERVKRTAFLIRTWDDYSYTSDDIINLRSIISELAINTGGEYGVHLLVHFWGVATLWSEPLMALVYNDLGENEFRGLPLHGVYRSSFMPVQWFASKHPEYDFFWNWEMDTRYSGNLYELLSAAGRWAKAQPRKQLWERSGRFYIPAFHGPWADFSRTVEKQAPVGDAVWGPAAVEGVEADLVVLNPLFDPEGTEWLLANDTTGYTFPQGRGGPPRRAAIIATSRLSRRLVARMHAENAHHRHAAFTEMWPATCALHHGLKAAYVPHPAYTDRKWPLWYLEKTFNHGVGGSAGGRKESVFGPREHNFKGMSWYYNSVFAQELYQMWVLGRGEKIEREDGRMCLRGMLFHPMKRVEDRP